jgi:1-deoxy-D-xylulose-5-phosphate synthase
MRFIKPIDADLVIQLAQNHSLLVTVEENSLIGGAGAEVARVIESLGSPCRLIRLGLPDRFIDHGDQSLLLAELGLDATGIAAAVRNGLHHLQKNAANAA